MMWYYKKKLRNGSEIMADGEKNVCKNCTYFSRGLTEGGYCKLYRHNLSMPERICSRFEPKREPKTVLSQRAEEGTHKKILKPAVGNKSTRRLTYFIGLICTIILSIVVLFVGVLFASVVIAQEVGISVKLGTMAVALSVLFLFSWHLVMLLRRHRWVYVVYLVLTLALVLLLLFDFGNVWLTLNNEITRVVEFIYYGII